MFYHREQDKMQKKVLMRQPKQYISDKHKQILRLERAYTNLRRNVDREEEELYRREKEMKEREQQLDEEYKRGRQELQREEMKELRCYAADHPEIKVGVCLLLESYIKGLLRHQHFCILQQFGSGRLMGFIRGKIRAKLNLREVQRQLKKIFYKRKFEFEGCKLMLTLKRAERPGECIVSVYGYVLHADSTQYDNQLHISAEKIYQRNTNPLYVLHLQKKRLTTLEAFLRERPSVVATCRRFLHKLRTKLYTKSFVYFQKHRIDLFFQHQISNVEPPRQALFLVRCTRDGLLTIESLYVSTKIYIEHRLQPPYKEAVQELLESTTISYRQNKLMRRLNYKTFSSNVVRIQTVYRSHSLSKRFRASQLRGCIRLVSSKDRRSFVSCMFGTAAQTIYFESYDKPTVACTFDKRYSAIVRQAMEEVGQQSDISHEQFQHFIQEIQRRIHKFQEDEQTAFRNQPLVFFQRLRRLFFKIKVRAEVRRKRLFVVKVQLDQSLMAMLCFQALVTKDFVEVHIHKLARVAGKGCRTFKFLLRKKLFEGGEPTPRGLRKLFYLSEGCCVLSPQRQPGRHYIRWLSELSPTSEFKHHLLYNLFSENRCFYLEVIVARGCSLLPLEYFELPQKQVAGLNNLQLEILVRSIVCKQWVQPSLAK